MLTLAWVVQALMARPVDSALLQTLRLKEEARRRLVVPAWYLFGTGQTPLLDADWATHMPLSDPAARPSRASLFLYRLKQPLPDLKWHVLHLQTAVTATLVNNARRCRKLRTIKSCVAQSVIRR